MRKMMGEKMPVIDVHAHFLPGIDDGSRSMEETMQLLMRAAEQGITAAIATPHYSRRRKTEGLRELAEAVREEAYRWNPEFRIYLGQETYYHEELVERLQNGEGYTLADTRYVPVLAHMERYGCLREEGRAEDLSGCGCWFQMNYESLSGSWFSGDTRWCRKQVLDGKVQLLGTDMHRMDYRPPEIAKAMDWMKGRLSVKQIEDLTYRNAYRILRSREPDTTVVRGACGENE